MKVPDRVTLQLLSDPDEDLTNIIVELTVSTGQRNPRRIQFQRTDSAGRSSIDRHDFLGQFSDATDTDIMGSWGSIEDAFPTVEVSLHDTSYALAAGSRTWPLGKYEKTKWPSVAAEYAYRTACRNREFRADTIFVNLYERNDIDFFVSRIAHHGG